MKKASARARLTALYSCLFALSSAIVIVVIYVAMRATLPRLLLVTLDADAGGALMGTTGGDAPPEVSAELFANTVGHSVADNLLRVSILIMLGMLLVSVALGWLVAGRVLAPVHAMTEQAARISARQLSERLPLSEPHDELWRLGTTLNDMIDRVQNAFDAERRLIANMSHELRTPLATQRAILELEFGDDQEAAGRVAEQSDSGLPDAGLPDAGAMWQAGHAALAQNRRAARVIDAMLTLARIEHAGSAAREEVDLAGIIDRAVQVARPEADPQALRWQIECERPSVVRGDRPLLERMVDNLVTNAVRYNAPGGTVWIESSRGPDGLSLRIANDGMPIEATEVERLTMPFKRGAPERTGSVRGEGLGMSIVAAIARAHGAALKLAARPDGGLEVTIEFPPTE